MRDAAPASGYHGPGHVFPLPHGTGGFYRPRLVLECRGVPVHNAAPASAAVCDPGHRAALGARHVQLPSGARVRDLLSALPDDSDMQQVGPFPAFADGHSA